MWKICTSGVTVFALVGALVSVLAAAAPTTPSAGTAPRDPEAIRQEMENTKAHMAALEREAVAAEQREQAAKDMTDLRTQAAERLPALKEELAELAKPVEGDPPTPAQRAQRDARINHVSTCHRLDEQIAAMQGAAALPKAKALLQERDLAEIRWTMVTGPTADRAVQIEALHQSAQDAKKGLEQVIALQKLHDQDLKDAEAEFALRRQRVRNESEFVRLFDEANKSISGE